MSNVKSSSDTFKTPDVSVVKKKEILLDSRYTIITDNTTSLTRKQDFYQIYIDRAFAQGKRAYMEDFNLIAIDPSTGILLKLLCDGHGGDTLAKELINLVANRIFKLLEQAQLTELYIREIVSDVTQRKALLHTHWLKVERDIKEEILSIDRYLYSFFQFPHMVGGSTLTVLAYLP